MILKLTAVYYYIRPIQWLLYSNELHKCENDFIDCRGSEMNGDNQYTDFCVVIQWIINN